MTKIKNIIAREILDSRGNPTLEITVISSPKAKGTFGVPAGVSTGQNEAKELRDNDLARFGGLGVKTAINRLKEHIVPALRGVNISAQREIDEILKQTDGTADKSFLGGNTMIGVSIAAAKAAACSKKLKAFEYLKTLADIKPSRPEPLLFFNFIEGGQHANSFLTFQEFHLVPQVDSIEKALQIAWQVQTNLKMLLKNKFRLGANVGDEGGIAAPIKSPAEALELLKQAADKSGWLNQIKLSLDAAASSFYKNGSYHIAGSPFTTKGLANLYAELIEAYPIFSIEDPFNQNDFESFSYLKKQQPGLLVVGDDLTVTNPKIIEKAADSGSINAVIIKPNQVGTLTDTLKAMQVARKKGLECIVSHRGGETNDAFIADLAYAFGCFGIKAGGLQRGERLAKYNRLWQLTSI